MFYKTVNSGKKEILININFIIFMTYAPNDKLGVILLSNGKEIFLETKEYEQLRDFLPQIVGE
jgi:hypothetical protein